MASICVMVNGRLKSTRCPKKLIRPFAGTTLFDIAMGKLSKLADTLPVYVGIAESELIAIAERYPSVSILHRSNESVLPGYGNHRTLYEHYSWVNEDYIMWLNPCHPLISIATIRAAIEDTKNFEFNSYTSVVDSTDWIFDVDGLPVTNKSAGMLSSAHSQKFFKVAHAFHIINKSYFMETGQVWTLSKGDPSLIPIPEEENFDVNTEMEFVIAEAAYQKLNR